MIAESENKIQIWNLLSITTTQHNRLFTHIFPLWKHQWKQQQNLQLGETFFGEYNKSCVVVDCIDTQYKDKIWNDGEAAEEGKKVFQHEKN